MDLAPFAWLHPVAVRTVLEYARQAYLNGYPERAREILDPYTVALEPAVQLPQEWNDDDATLRTSSLAQVRNEVVDILSRIDQHLDYFGYPSGWVPMLSFEVMRQLFEDEVKSAGDILYVTWYLGRAGTEVTNKVGALLRLRNELSSEFDDLGTGLTSASKFNEQDALQSAIDATNLASEVVESTVDQNLADFQTFTGAGDPRLGAAFLVGQ